MVFTISERIDEFGQGYLLASADNLFSCHICTFGCTVVSWKHLGKEQLFVSQLAVFNSVKAIRGGIPLVFPQFGQPTVSMPQHGFARTSFWKLESSVANDGLVSATFSLSDNETTMQLWPHKFLLQFYVELTRDGLKTSFTIVNTGANDFHCQSLLHTYLRISNVNLIKVRGFEGCQYFDKLLNNASDVETRDEIQIGQEVDRIYLSKDLKSQVVSVIDHGNKSIIHVERNAYYSSGSTNSEQQEPIKMDCVLWNAWIEKSKAIADLNDEAYNYYVCVEPGLVATTYPVAPNQRLTISQTLRSE